MTGRKTLDRIIYAVVLAAAALACFGATAEAKRPALTLERADRVAALEARETMLWTHPGDEECWPEDEPCEPLPIIVRYELDPCDRVSASRAECDLTYIWSDGEECDDILTITTSRRNRLLIRSEGDGYCSLGE